MTPVEIEAVVLQAMRTLNLARRPEGLLQVSPTAPLFGAGSPLDSMGLLTLLIEVEEALQDAGEDVTLSDARAVSRDRSPFRDVPSLVDFISGLIAERR